MTYTVKIADYNNAFNNADDYVFTLHGEIENNGLYIYEFQQIVTEWCNVFPNIKFIDDGLPDKKIMDGIKSIGFAQFQSEGDFLNFMLRWS